MNEQVFINGLFAEVTSGLSHPAVEFLRRQARPCVYLVKYRNLGDGDTIAGVIEQRSNGRVDISIDIGKCSATSVFPRAGTFSLTFEVNTASYDIPFSACSFDVDQTFAFESTTAETTRTSLAAFEGLSLPWVWSSGSQYDPDFPEDPWEADLCWMASELRSRILSHASNLDRLIALGGHPFRDDDCSHLSDDGCILVAEIGIPQLDAKYRFATKLRYFVDRQPLPLQHCDDVWCAR